MPLGKCDFQTIHSCGRIRGKLVMELIISIWIRGKHAGQLVADIVDIDYDSLCSQVFDLELTEDNIAGLRIPRYQGSACIFFCPDLPSVVRTADIKTFRETRLRQPPASKGVYYHRLILPWRRPESCSENCQPSCSVSLPANCPPQLSFRVMMSSFCKGSRVSNNSCDTVSSVKYTDGRTSDSRRSYFPRI